MSNSIKNVIILGATGSVGAPILEALLAEPSFNVTIVSRATSSASFPSHVPVIKVSDAFTTEELTEAFKGQDAVVVALSTGPVVTGERGGLAFRLIDAALAAGVKRYIPSEFGANNLDPRARALVPTYDRKGETLEYLIKTCDDSNGKMTWSSICCGSWLDWALDPSKSGNFLGIDVQGRKATVYDSGTQRFAVTTSKNTGLAVAKVLLNPALTANKQIFLCDFSVSTRQIVDALEAETKAKFHIEEKQSGPEIKKLQAQFDAGEVNAMYYLLAISFGADVDVEYDFEAEQEVWNSKLGLPKVTLEEVVHDAVELAARS
jgi:nucleoside-diphosphate-sugar epimerase